MHAAVLETSCARVVPSCSDGSKYAADLKDLLLTATPGKVAGFMAETIQGVGGAVPLASGYLPEVYKVRIGHDAMPDN